MGPLYDVVVLSRSWFARRSLLQSNRTMIIEVREASEVWSEWSPDSFPLKVVLLNLETLQYDAPIEVCAHTHSPGRRH